MLNEEDKIIKKLMISGTLIQLDTIDWTSQQQWPGPFAHWPLKKDLKGESTWQQDNLISYTFNIIP